MLPSSRFVINIFTEAGRRINLITMVVTTDILATHATRVLFSTLVKSLVTIEIGPTMFASKIGPTNNLAAWAA